MVGIVSRLTDQKGLDLVQCVMDELCSDDMQLGGTGNRRRALREYVPPF